MKLEEVQKAVLIAFEYFQAFQEILNDKVENIALEEVTVSENSEFWHITLGFDRPSSARQDYYPDREYKVFVIRAGTGDIESMKVRKF